MKRADVTPEAKADIFEIWDYVASKGGVDAADRVAAAIDAEISKIAEMPGAGHFREDIVADKRIRFSNVYSYLIAYRWELRPIQIIAVVHGQRDLPAFFQERTG